LKKQKEKKKVTNVPSGFRQQEPQGKQKRRADSCEKPGRFQAPVPLIGIEHVWHQDSHDNAHGANNADCKADGVCAKS
jgi:hypothetical protein